MSVERRRHERIPFSRPIKVARLNDIETLVARDLSAGGLFIRGCDAQIGDTMSVDFEAEELPGVRVRAEVTVVRRVEGADPGVGVQFVRFDDGGTAVEKMIKFLLRPGH